MVGRHRTPLNRAGQRLTRSHGLLTVRFNKMDYCHVTKSCTIDCSA